MTESVFDKSLVRLSVERPARSLDEITLQVDSWIERLHQPLQPDESHDIEERRMAYSQLSRLRNCSDYGVPLSPEESERVNELYRKVVKCVREYEADFLKYVKNNLFDQFEEQVASQYPELSPAESILLECELKVQHIKGYLNQFIFNENQFELGSAQVIIFHLLQMKEVCEYPRQPYLADRWAILKKQIVELITALEKVKDVYITSIRQRSFQSVIYEPDKTVLHLIEAKEQVE
jgi:hypothetical protein